MSRMQVGARVDYHYIFQWKRIRWIQFTAMKTAETSFETINSMVSIRSPLLQGACRSFQWGGADDPCPVQIEQFGSGCSTKI